MEQQQLITYIDLSQMSRKDHNNVESKRTCDISIGKPPDQLTNPSKSKYLFKFHQSINYGPNYLISGFNEFYYDKESATNRRKFFVGNFVEGLPHGQNIVQYFRRNDREKYKGGFNYGFWEGKGVWYNYDNKSPNVHYEGFFKRGIPIGENICMYGKFGY